MLLVITGLLVLGALQGETTSATDSASSVDFDLGAFAVTLVWISFAYSGWNAVVYVAGEVRDPERNLQRSLWLATALVTLLYLGLNALFLASAAPAELAGRADVAAIAAEALGGDVLRRAVSGLVALALFTSISAMVMAGPRVYARMAADGLFPRVFTRGRDTPAAAVALQVGLAVAVVWVSDLVQLLGYIGFTLGLSAAATVGGLFALRWREGQERIPIPGYPWVPGVFVLATLGTSGFMLAREPFESAMGLLTIALALPLYWLRKRQRADAAG